MNLHLFWPTKASTIPQQHSIIRNLMEELSNPTKRQNRAQGLTFHQALQETLLNYRSSLHCTRGYATTQLMIRRQFRLPLSILQTPFQVVTSDVPSTDQLAQDIKSQQAKMKAYFDHKHPVQIPKFQPGQLLRIKKSIQTA